MFSWCPLSSLTLTSSSRFPEPWGKGFIWWRTPIYTLYRMSGCGSLHLFPSAARKSLSGRSNELWLYQSIIRNHLFVCLFVWGLVLVLPVVFDFFSWFPKQCGYRLLPMKWAGSQIRHWLAAPTSSVPPLPYRLCPPFSFGTPKSSFPYRRNWDVGMKAPHRHQLDCLVMWVLSSAMRPCRVCRVHPFSQ